MAFTNISTCLVSNLVRRMKLRSWHLDWYLHGTTASSEGRLAWRYAPLVKGTRCSDSGSKADLQLPFTPSHHFLVPFLSFLSVFFCCSLHLWGAPFPLMKLSPRQISRCFNLDLSDKLELSCSLLSPLVFIHASTCPPLVITFLFSSCFHQIFSFAFP